MAAGKYSERAANCYRKPFPLLTFPDTIRDIVTNISLNKSVSEGYLAAPLLAATGHLMNNSSIIGKPGTNYDGLKQPSNIFVAVVGYSGTNKTSGLSTIESAIQKVDSQALNTCKVLSNRNRMLLTT